MSLQLNLEKSRAALQLCLAKAGILAPPAVDLAFVLDVSASFADEHRAGISDRLLTRLVPWGLTFDPDQQLEVFTFSSGEASVHAAGAVNADNCAGFVGQRIVGRVPGWAGGTDYAPVLAAVLRRFGWLEASTGMSLRQRCLAWLAGKAAEAPAKVLGCPSLVIFVTDGENADAQRTLSVLQASQQRRDGVYFLFLGISNQGNRFPFLESLGQRFENTAFIAIDDLRGFVAMDDEALNQTLLGTELLAWLRRN